MTGKAYERQTGTNQEPLLIAMGSRHRGKQEAPEGMTTDT